MSAADHVAGVAVPAAPLIATVADPPCLVSTSALARHGVVSDILAIDPADDLSWMDAHGVVVFHLHADALNASGLHAPAFTTAGSCYILRHAQGDPLDDETCHAAVVALVASSVIAPIRPKEMAS